MATDDEIELLEYRIRRLHDAATRRADDAWADKFHVEAGRILRTHFAAIGSDEVDRLLFDFALAKMSRARYLMVHAVDVRNLSPATRQQHEANCARASEGIRSAEDQAKQTWPDLEIRRQRFPLSPEVAEKLELLDMDLNDVREAVDESADKRN